MPEPVMCVICGWDVRSHPPGEGHAPVPETLNDPAAPDNVKSTVKGGGASASA